LGADWPADLLPGSTFSSSIFNTKSSSSALVFVLDGELARLESGLAVGWCCGPRHEFAFIMQVPSLQRVFSSVPEQSPHSALLFKSGMPQDEQGCRTSQVAE